MAEVFGDDPPPYATLSAQNRELKQLPGSSADEDANCEGSRELLVAPSAPSLEMITEPRNIPYDLPSLVFEDIYEACIQYVKKNFCYGSKFVKKMALTDIFNGVAFHYALESFVEKRESATLTTPYSGQPIDGPENGPPPDGWDFMVQAMVMLQDGKIRIQQTATVSQCSVCLGIGRVRCEFCTGRGGDLCYHCCGTGRGGSGPCTWCGGTGRQLMLQDDFISDTSNMPPDLCKMATGKRLFYEEEEQVSPILNAPDPSVQQESVRLVELHKDLFKKQRFIKQRQLLRAIPLTKVMYQWKRKTGEFYVYGKEKKVYFQDYPQKCCCCTCF